MADFLRCKDCKHDIGKCLGVSRRGRHKNCFEPKVMTNANRIRAMSDEELEEGIRRLSIGYEPWCDRHCKMNGDDDCNRCLRSWLQQPAEPPKEESE